MALLEKHSKINDKGLKSHFPKISEDTLNGDRVMISGTQLREGDTRVVDDIGEVVGLKFPFADNLLVGTVRVFTKLGPDEETGADRLMIQVGTKEAFVAGEQKNIIIVGKDINNIPLRVRSYLSVGGPLRNEDSLVTMEYVPNPQRRQVQPFAKASRIIQAAVSWLSPKTTHSGEPQLGRALTRG